MYRIISVLILFLLLTSNFLSIIPVYSIDKAVVPSMINICEKLAPETRKDRCEGYIGDSLNVKMSDVKFPFFYYAYEITHDYNGPNEGVVKYLNENSKEEDNNKLLSFIQKYS